MNRCMACRCGAAVPTLQPFAGLLPDLKDLMPRLLPVTVFLTATVALLASASPASAQRFGFGNAGQVQALSVGYYVIDFEFDGDGEPAFLFNFDQPAYGVVYSRPNILITGALGEQSADDDHESLRLIELSLTTWGELYLSGLGSPSTRVYIPIVLYTHYRRVEARGDEGGSLDDFNVTVIGIGGGLGLGRAFGDNILFEARTQPVIGLASSAFADAFGSSYLVDADVQLHLARLFSKVGLSLGYTYRWQVWNVNTSNLFPDETDNLFDYRGQQHLFRVGLNW